MEPNVHGTFISEKTNKIRWRPQPFNSCHSFITASWDNKLNSIKLWDFRETADDPDIYPFVVAEHRIQGDVTEAKFLNPDLCVVSTSLGATVLLKLSVDIAGAHVIENAIVWEKLHGFANGDVSSCSSLATYENDVATVGEDGRVNFLSSQSETVVRTIDDADSCSLNCVAFLKHNEVLTANSRGQMKVWDLRAQENTPSATFMLSGEHVMPTCMVHHPTHRHLLVVGDEEGSLTVWDLRKNTFPVNLLTAHDEAVSEIQFHPEFSDQLFSCSHSGDVWQWTGHTKDVASSENTSELEAGPWFVTDGMKNLEVLALMPKLHKPVNALDLNRDKVVCGCDNEAIYLINGVNLYM